MRAPRPMEPLPPSLRLSLPVEPFPLQNPVDTWSRYRPAWPGPLRPWCAIHTHQNKHAWMRLPADPKRGAREAHVHLADAKGGGLSPL